MDVPFELDDIFHLPGWRELPAEGFRAKVSQVTSEEGWVIDGNYLVVQDLIWDRADTVVRLQLGTHRRNVPSGKGK